MRSLHNPYLTFFEALPPACRRDPGLPVDSRELWFSEWLSFKAAVARHFAWAVPTERAIDGICRHTDRVLDVGCGSGYWAWLMEQGGADVVAVDAVLPPYAWHDVAVGTEAEVERHPDRTLFLCWPPWGDAMAFNALSAYGGDTVVYVGEWMAGSAEHRFFSLLAAAFEVTCAVEIPQWHMRTDRLTIHRRRSRPKP